MVAVPSTDGALQPERIRISVILATRNRADLLAGALESLSRQSIGEGNYEVIVVDNGCTDHTPDLVKNFTDLHPSIFRLLSEPTPGLSVARNTGIRQARHTAITFLDDDARADGDWLECLSAALAGDEVGAAGGPIRVKWTTARPEWFFPELNLFLYSELDYGPARLQLDPSRPLFASNLAVKRSVFEEVGLFSEGLGRKGQSLLSFEEVELQARIHRRGYQVIYQPAAIVDHLALPERASVAFMRRQAWHGGRSHRACESATSARGRSLAAMPFSLAKGAAGLVLKHRLGLAQQRELIYWSGYFAQGLYNLLHDFTLPPPPRLEPLPSVTHREGKA